ncbi:MAG: hypothetical protein ABIG35_05570 [Pseudomonadota bacterium]
MRTGGHLSAARPDASRWLGHSITSEASTAEFLWVDDTDSVSQVRNEVRTSGYSLIKLRTSVDWKYVLDQFHLMALNVRF